MVAARANACLAREGRTVLMGVGAATPSAEADAPFWMEQGGLSSGYSAYTHVGEWENTPDAETPPEGGANKRRFIAVTALEHPTKLASGFQRGDAGILLGGLFGIVAQSGSQLNTG